MSMQFIHFVGIDVSKLTLNVAVCDSSRKILAEFELPNTPATIRVLLSNLKKALHIDLKTTVFCLEHTGNYCHPFLLVSAMKGLLTWMENPVSIKRSLGLVRGKSDQADAKQIAVYACRFIDKLRLWVKPSQEVAELKALSSERSRILRAINLLSTPSKEAATMGNVVAAGTQKYSAKAVAALKTSLETVEGRIAEIVGTVPEIKHNMDLLQTITGVGPETALMFIVLTRNFTVFQSPKQFACFCGVAPFPNSSGTSLKGKAKISPLGNREAKATLTMAAWSASQSDPELRSYHQRRVGEGMERSASINILRNKLIGRAFAVIKRQQPFQGEWNPQENKA